MESVVFDNSPVNPRKSVVGTATNTLNRSASFTFRAPARSFPSSFASVSSLSQLFLNVNGGGAALGSGLFGSRPPPPPIFSSLPPVSVPEGSSAAAPPPPRPLYSSLPSFSSSARPSTSATQPRPVPLHQPPLLPLPLSRSSSALPAPVASGVATVPAVKPREHRKKPKPSPSARKETRSPAAPSKAVAFAPRKQMQEEAEGDTGEEEILFRSVYSLSPPPSSLPLPRFSLTRPKATVAAASCIAEAVAGGKGGGGVDAGATDDLRRLLRL